MFEKPGGSNTLHLSRLFLSFFVHFTFPKFRIYGHSILFAGFVLIVRFGWMKGWLSYISFECFVPPYPSVQSLPQFCCQLLMHSHFTPIFFTTNHWCI